MPIKYSEEIIEDGIVIGRFLVGYVDYDIAKKVMDKRLQLTGNTSYPTLIDIRSVNNFDNDAKVLLASKEASLNITAGALLVKSVYQRIAGNFFLFVNKPPIPAKLFTEEAAAIEWLSQFKDANS